MIMGERVIFQADGKTSQDMSKSNPVQFSSEINTPLLSQSWIPREKTENIESSKKTVHHIISPTIFDRSITFYDFPFPSTFGNSKWFERYDRATATHNFPATAFLVEYSLGLSLFTS